MIERVATKLMPLPGELGEVVAGEDFTGRSGSIHEAERGVIGSAEAVFEQDLAGSVQGRAGKIVEGERHDRRERGDCDRTTREEAGGVAFQPANHFAKQGTGHWGWLIVDS